MIDVDALTKRLVEFCNKSCPYTAKARNVMCGSCFMGLALEAVEDAPTIEPDLKWIPCSVRLPKEEGEYLVSFDDGFIATTGYYEGDFELWADAGEPLAWMPLPEGYREEK